MGKVNALGFAEAVTEGSVSLDNALLWHLQSNHYPPVHPIFLETAKKAIKHARAEEWTTVLTLPNKRRLTVQSVVEQLHLDAFIWVEEPEVDGTT